MQLKKQISERGMFFMNGIPPKENLEPFIVYAGGCFSEVVHWRDDMQMWCHHSGDFKTPYKEEIISYMRLPQPAFWLEIDKPENLLKTEEIYKAGPLKFENPL